MGRAIHRGLCVAILVAAATALVVGFLRARDAAALNGWEGLDLGWLTFDAWSDQRPWLHAGVAGIAAFAVAAFLSFLRPTDGSRPNAVVRMVDGLGRTWLAAVALVTSALGPGLVARASRPSPPDAPNLLFVLVDTWRADHAGFLGYDRDVSPRLDALAAQGVVFERAMASSGWTKPSVATLFTGLMPSEHRALSQPVPGLRVRGIQLPAGATTFVEILAGRGWDTGMWSNNPNILPERGFGQGAAHFEDYFHQRTPERDAGRSEYMLPDVQAWLDERDGSRPFCAYVHVMDPHFPYVAPAPFAGTFDQSGLDFQLTGPVVDEFMSGKRSVDDVTDAMRQRIVDIYDEELLYVDHHLGPFLEGVLSDHPDTVVVVVGDHGEEFLEHGQFGHGHSLYQELMHVPLVILGPDLQPRRVDSQVRLMDVFPTVLELLDVDVPLRGVQGQSLLPLIAGSETEHRLAPMETGGDERPAWQWRALSDGRLKWIRREADLPTKRPIPPLSERDLGPRPYAMLFDLDEDPGEVRDLLPGRAVDAAKLFDLMRTNDWWRSPEDVLQLPVSSANLEGDLDALRNLGYAGDDEAH